MKLIKLFSVLAIALSFSACSTIINTTTEEVTLKTTPDNAKITIDGVKFGTSPQQVNIDRGQNHILKFELPGYEVYEINITKKLSSWVWLNAFNFFLPGFAIDYLSGGMYNLFPTNVDVTLTPLPKVEPTKKK